MRQDPIIFRDQHEHKTDFFQGFKKEDGSYVYSRDVLLSLGGGGKAGTYARFRIIDKWEKAIPDYKQMLEEKKDQTEVAWVSSGGETLIVDKCYYATDNVKYWPEMDDLYSREVIGRIAERLAQNLYIGLFMFSEEMKKYLPKVVEFYSKISKDAGWSGKEESSG